MSFSYRLPLVLVATAALFTGVCRAQDDDEDEDDFGTFGFLAASPRSMTVSMKVTQGAQVRFGNLGTVPNAFDHSKGASLGRKYDDGEVKKDDYRLITGPGGALAAERDINGELRNSRNGQFLLVGDRYQVLSPGGGLAGDFLAYNSSRSRDWRYRSAAQATERTGYIAFHKYRTESNGGSFNSSNNVNGGFELSLSHALTNPTKRFSISLTASLGLSGIYAYKAGKVRSTLFTYTDLYQYYPVTPGDPAPFDPTPTDGRVLPYRYDAPGGILPLIDQTTVRETTIGLSQNPDIQLGEDDDKEAEVEGQWRLKGAYFTLKLGPQLNAMLTRSIGLSAGFGLAGTYASTRYSAIESFEVDGVEDEIATSPEASTRSIMLAGYYANIDATWTLNDRTGFFAGFSYEQLGEYKQELDKRTAKVDLSATAGVRGGMTFKF